MPKKLRNIWCLRSISIRLLISYSGELLQKGEKISKVTNFVDQKASKFPNSKYFWAVCSVNRRILVVVVVVEERLLEANVNGTQLAPRK